MGSVRGGGKAVGWMVVGDTGDTGWIVPQLLPQAYACFSLWSVLLYIHVHVNMYACMSLL